MFGADEEVDWRAVSRGPNGTLESNKKTETGRTHFDIELPRDLGPGDACEFTVHYRRRLMVKTVSRNWLHRQFLVVFRVSFKNECDELHWDVSFPRKRTRLLACLPENKSPNRGSFKSAPKGLPSNQHSLAVLLVGHGLLPPRIAQITGPVSTGVAAGLITFLVTAFFGG